jgi:hypothetical protein
MSAHFMRWILLAGLALSIAGCGGGGGSNDTSPPPAPTSTSNAIAYQNSTVLGGTSPVALTLTPATATTHAVLTSPVAAPLIVAGDNALLSLYQSAAYAGAGIACVSAPTDSIGTVTGVNAGVNVKSVAALLNNAWTIDTNPAATWSTLGANHASFDGWENCGAKAEGSPSPASTLIVGADGSFTDNVFDGNPATTVRIVDQGFTAAQASAMLSSAGLADTSQPNAPQIIRLRLYHDASNRTLLIEQAIPVAGASNTNPGYVAIYFER